MPPRRQRTDARRRWRLGQIVTAVFALGADDAGNPPNGGVIEEQAFDEGLHQVHQIILTEDVRQFVNENGFYLRDGQTGEQAHGHQNHGARVADDYRHFGQTRFEERSRLGDAQPPREPVETLLPIGRRAANAGEAQATRCDPSP